MTDSPSQVAKLKAIGYTVEASSTLLPDGSRVPVSRLHYRPNGLYLSYLDAHDNEAKAMEAALAHCQSPEGLVLTMAAKVQAIRDAPEHDANGIILKTTPEGKWEASLAGFHWDTSAEGASPEAAVDSLFWKVP